MQMSIDWGKYETFVSAGLDSPDNGEEVERLKSLLAECQTVLEFYAHKDFDREIGTPCPDDKKHCMVYHFVWVNKAREMLAKLKEMK